MLILYYQVIPKFKTKPFPKKRTDKSALALSHIPKPLNSDRTPSTSPKKRSHFHKTPNAIAPQTPPNNDRTFQTTKQRSHISKRPTTAIALSKPANSDRTSPHPQKRSHLHTSRTAINSVNCEKWQQLKSKS